MAKKVKKSGGVESVGEVKGSMGGLSPTKRKGGGRSARLKGHNFERKLSSEMRDIGFDGARRQLEYHADDAKGVDIQGTDPYKIQCKATKKYVSLNTIKEVQCDREFGDIPILVAKADNEPVLAVMYWEDLKHLIKEIKREG